MIDCALVRADRGRILDWLKGMIGINSVNPSLVEGGAGEAAMAGFTADAGAGMGLDVSIDGPSPDRPNVIAVLKGSRPSPRKNLLLNGHLDTVGLGGMNEPLVPRLVGGRLYGRGALDMKGGLAAILGALDVICRSGVRLQGDVVFAATSDEEYASIGARHAADRIRAGGAIVAEATDMGLCLAHKGFAWLKVETHGRAAHGSLPSDGVDAITKMGGFIAKLEEYSRVDLGSRRHGLLGSPSLHASTITGGTELSTYPDRCTLMIERRTIPGESADMVLGEIRAILDSLSKCDPLFKADCEVSLFRPAYEVSGDSPIAEAVSDAFASVVGSPPRVIGLAAWLDSGIFGPGGIPSVIIGPSGRGQHGDEEFVDIDSVCDLAEVIAGAALRFCGVSR